MKGTRVVTDENGSHKRHIQTLRAGYLMSISVVLDKHKGALLMQIYDIVDKHKGTRGITGVNFNQLDKCKLGSLRH